MSPPSLAYLANGQLHLKLGEGPVRALDSAFGQQVRDRHLQIHQEHSRSPRATRRTAPRPGPRAAGHGSCTSRRAWAATRRARFPRWALPGCTCSNLESGTLETLASEPGRDFLCPQLDAEGNLYCVRRPHRIAGDRSFARLLVDIVLIPARLLFAVFQYLNFFSARYTGKPLTTAGARRKGADMRQMMVWSNLVEAGQTPDGDEPPPAVPRSWQLVRIRPGQPAETLAEGVLAFDLAGDGSVLYSTGSAIHYVGSDGRHQRLVGGERVEAVVVLS